MKHPFLLIFLGISLSWSATYYVSPTGSDSNSGTSTNPFKTIQHAAAVVQPGDKVIIGSGVYNEVVDMKSSGTAGAPVTFEGERGSKGEFLSIVDPANHITGWERAPGESQPIYRVKLSQYPEWLGVGAKCIRRVDDATMKSNGLKYLAKPSTETIYAYGMDIPVLFWDGWDALWGFNGLNSYAYVRFRNGDDPNQKDLRISSAGSVVLNISDKSHIIVKNLMIRGSKTAVRIIGSSAANNRIFDCHLTGATTIVQIKGGASYNSIKNCEIFNNNYAALKPGSYYNGHQTYACGVRSHLYIARKGAERWVEDVNGVQILGSGPCNEIDGNRIYEVNLGAVNVDATKKALVKNNVIHSSSSCGFIFYHDLDTVEVFDNLMYDVNINVRFMSTDHSSLRKVFIYRNRFSGALDPLRYSEPAGLGEGMYFHYDSVPPPALPAEIWFYHNSFCGSSRGFTLSGYAHACGGLPKTRFVNNIFSCPSTFLYYGNFGSVATMMGAFDYNWCAKGYSSNAWTGQHNISAQGQFLWSMDSIPRKIAGVDTMHNYRLPDFLLPKALTPVLDPRAKGMDLSKSFSLQGKNYPALPGMFAGYFDGSAPDLGAVQDGGNPVPSIKIENIEMPLNNRILPADMLGCLYGKEIELKIFDISGRTLSGTSFLGRAIGSGHYCYSLKSGNQIQRSRIFIIR